MNTVMTQDDQYLIQRLRERGFSVCVIAPSTLRGVDPLWIESLLRDYANSLIDRLGHRDSDDQEG